MKNYLLPKTMTFVMLLLLFVAGKITAQTPASAKHAVMQPVKKISSPVAPATHVAVLKTTKKLPPKEIINKYKVAAKSEDKVIPAITYPPHLNSASGEIHKPSSNQSSPTDNAAGAEKIIQGSAPQHAAVLNAPPK